VDRSNNLYVAGAFASSIQKITPEGTVSDLPSGLTDGNALAVDGAGNIYYTYGETINKVTPAGVVSTLAGMNFAGVGVRYADGTGTEARFDLPGGLAVDGSGNVYVADSGNAKLRKITPDGVVTTLPATVHLAAPINVGGLAMDGAGNLYVTDPWNCTVTKVTPTGTVSVIGGTEGTLGCRDGIGSNARFNYPSGIAVDSAGNVYVADTENHAIRKGQVAGPPTIATQPVSQTVAPGANAQFSVSAAAVPAPTYQWYFNGSIFNGATTDALSFANAHSTDAGDYTVVVSNALGSVTSAKATLTVSTAPVTPPPASGSSSGGGGAIDLRFGLALLVLVGARRLLPQRSAPAQCRHVVASDPRNE
jgi:sugar lactone lactonase YvrE